jgi:MFS family permease
MAVTADALSTLLAALAIFSITKTESPQAPMADRNFLNELREGAGVIFGNPLLRNLAASTATLNLGSSVFYAVFLLFIYNQLKLSPFVAGLALGIGSVGFPIGALSAPKVSRKLGLGRTLAASLLVSGIGLLTIPVAMYGPAAPLLAALWMLSSVGIPIYNINQISLRQAIVSDKLQGRMNATMRTIIWGTIPVGAFVGGILGTQLGILWTIIIGALVSTLSVLFIILGPVGSLHEIPKRLSDSVLSSSLRLADAHAPREPHTHQERHGAHD